MSSKASLSATLASASPAALVGAGALAGALAAFALLRPRERRSAPALPAFEKLASAAPGTKTASSDEAEADALKKRIQAHYDGCSPSYQDLWGKHIHHGLWREGQEALSKEVAQERLVEEMAARARLPARAKVLDVGCGVGGTSCWLAARGHAVTGISLSPKQIEMAKENAAADKVSVRFLTMDAEALNFPGEDGSFDCVWCAESCSHYPHKERFFAHAQRLLKPGGKLVMVDWFAGDCIGSKMWTGVVADIERGMLLPPIGTVTGYANLMVAAGLRPIFVDDVSKECAKTWDLSLELVANPATLSLARSLGSDGLNFLAAFVSMKDGFASGAFRFTIVIAEKPTAAQLEN